MLSLAAVLGAPHTSTLNLCMKKKILISIASIILFFLLALTSIFTTFGIWDGAIPSAKFKLKVIDGQKKAVSGVKLTVFEKKGFLGLKRRISYRFPIQEFTNESQPVSNSNGVLEVSHVSKGLEIGGWAFALFWVVPISFGDPKFIVHFQAPDGRERSLEYYDLYEKCDEKPTILRDSPVACELEVVL